ncbi:chitin deacetylase, partial [Blyttiomyces sp. JEL0837]
LAGKNIPAIPTKPQGNPYPDYNMMNTRCVGDNMFAQTFDDGPSIVTPQLLDHLRASGTRLTFFNMGTNIKQFPCTLVQEMNDGHINCIHTWSHQPSTSLTNDQLVAEVLWTAAIMKSVIGKSPKCIRAPYGDIDERVMAIFEAMGLTVIWVDEDSRDWSYPQADSSVEPIVSLVKSWLGQSIPGGILALEHDLYSHEVQAGMQISDAIRASTREAVNIDTCLGTSGLGDGFQFPPSFVIPSISGSC